MILPDVNVLVYAFRDDVPQHPICKAWLDSVVLGAKEFGLSKLTLSALARITTANLPLRKGVPLSSAFAFCDNLLSQPHCKLVEPGPHHWETFRRLCIETNTIGRMVTDAWFAALAIEWNCEWVTMDRDFGRFPGLRWSMPTAPA